MARLVERSSNGRGFLRTRLGACLLLPLLPLLLCQETRGAPAASVDDERAERLFAEAEDLRARWEAEASREAIRKYLEARAYWQAGGRHSRAAEALRAVGEVHFNLGEYAQALGHFRRALAAARAAHDALAANRALNGVARSQVFLGDYPPALAHATRVLDYYRRTPARDPSDQSCHAQALNNKAEALYSLGRLKEARALFEQALAFWTAAADRAGQALAHLNLGYTFADSGDLQKASAHLHQSLALYQSVSDRRGEALALTAAGAVNSLLGERQTALDSHKQALEIFRAVGDRQGEAVALNSVGQVYEDLNEPRSALDYYRHALRLAREHNRRDSEAVSNCYVGRVFRALGDHDQALPHYRRCLSLSRALGKRRVEAYAFTDISLIYNAMGEGRVALNQFEEVLAVYRRAGDRRGQANTLKHIGDIHLAAGWPETAEGFYRRALAFSRLAGDRGGEASVLYDLARAGSERGDLDAALRHAADSIEIIEALRVQVASPHLRASYFASVHRHYGFYIDLLMQLHKLRPSEGHDAAALQASESARARTLLETLSEAHARLRTGVDPALLERERTLQQSLSAKAAYRMHLLNSPRTEADAEDVEQEIRQLTDEYREVQAHIRTQSPRYATLTQPQPLTLAEIQAELNDEETTLLEYSLGDARSYLWAVTARGVESFELPGRAEIEEAAREVYGLLTARQSESASFADYQERVLAADERYWQQAARLSQMLLGPAYARLRGKRLLVVADGALQYLPFEALPEPDANEPAPLVLKHEVAYLPSASTLSALRRDRAGREPAPNAVMVLADPVFGADDPRVSQTAAPAPEPALALLPRAFGDTDKQGRGVPRLPATLEEAEAIMSVAPWRGTLAAGFDATRAKAVGDEPGRHRVVHFATHAFVDGEHPELSGIMLSMVDRRGRAENGFLQLHDIYNLRLSAGLVVLSSCSTGLGKEMRGEGLVGLARGFMYAGAEGVVASLWKVDDRASAEFMKHFYGAMLRDGLAPAAALRAAKAKMWGQKRWRSPFYWAAFVLQGEYGQSVKVQGALWPSALSVAAIVSALLLLLLVLSKHFGSSSPTSRAGASGAGGTV